MAAPKRRGVLCQAACLVSSGDVFLPPCRAVRSLGPKKHVLQAFGGPLRAPGGKQCHLHSCWIFSKASLSRSHVKKYRADP